MTDLQVASESHHVAVVAATPSSMTASRKRRRWNFLKKKPKEITQARLLPGPVHDDQFIDQNIPHSKIIIKDPKSLVLRTARNHTPLTTRVKSRCYCTRQLTAIHRVTVIVRGVDPQIVGIGDAPLKKDADQIAYRSAAYQLYNEGVFNETTIRLSNSTLLTFAEAKRFLEFYCDRFCFSNPEIVHELIQNDWETRMSVSDRKIGFGIGKTKKTSIIRCYLDAVDYIEQCDPALWKIFDKEDAKTSETR